MGKANIIFRNGKSIFCYRNSGDDYDTVNSIINEVTVALQNNHMSYILCENGGFDPSEVVAVQIPNESDGDKE